MKQLIILTSLFFMFTACEKSTGDITANRNSVSSNENTEAVTASKAFTFDVNAQGWKIDSGATLAFVPFGGTPGGCIRGTDNGAATYWYFKAPAGLLKLIRSQNTTGGNFRLDFDLRAQSSNNTNQPDVIIVSPTATLVVAIADEPNDAGYKHFSVPFIHAGGWKFTTLNGTPATTGQIKKALHTITKLLTRGEFDVAAGNIALLDNVTFATL